MIRRAHTPGLFLHTSLLSLYCRCGGTPHARRMFDGMPLRDTVSRSARIAWFSSLGFAHLASDVFRSAQNGAFGVCKLGCASALAACARAKDSRNGRAGHGLAVVSGLARGVFLTNSVIDMYAQCGMIDEVRLVFDRADELNGVSWNLLLSAYVRMGWPEVAVNVLVWMHRSGVELDCFALSAIWKTCSELADSEDVRRMLHGCVIKVALDLDIFAGDTLFDMYAKNGGLDEAIKVFDCIPNPNVAIYNAMIAGFARLGDDACPELRSEAARLFSGMLQTTTRPSKLTFRSVLDVCNLMNATWCGRQVHAHVVLHGLQDDELIGSALIGLYSRARSVGDSLSCFRMSPKQEVLTWSSMITAYVHHGHFEEALGLFRDLLAAGKEPDMYTVSSATDACACLSVLKSGQQVQCYAVKSGLDQFAVCSDSQIGMYTNVGDIKASKKTLEQITCLSTSSWSAMISSYAVHGHGREALELFEKMEDRGVMMNGTAFLAVLTACNHGGLVDDAFRHYESMTRNYGLVPDVKHKACMVDLLGRIGRMADAEGFLLSSVFENDPLIWHALLRACRVHGDKERGLQVAAKLTMLEPFAPSAYVVLHNLHMSKGNISVAMRTRGLMRERGVKNERGVSWLERGRSFDRFIDGDGSCSLSSGMHAALGVLLDSVKQRSEHAGAMIWEFGFIGMKLGENSVSSHGELVAVALGLSTLPCSAPVRVMKNQRISWESHAVLKLLSHGEAREISVRDASQFHHFSQGSCSCGDYW